MNKPYINSCQITPNPVNQKQQISIVLDIEDKPIVFQKVIYYSGENKAGERIGIM
ncbi:hypothetical protein [Eisenbergiella tayi]|uniref:hypothetical protein n=1 Tax=Eisenbergiella tayi TaxID=1432052 RepID=UPI002A8284FE|nr:hypothetical protein [Eisenbergiella tayi]